MSTVCKYMLYNNSNTPYACLVTRPPWIINSTGAIVNAYPCTCLNVLVLEDFHERSYQVCTSHYWEICGLTLYLACGGPWLSAIGLSDPGGDAVLSIFLKEGHIEANINLFLHSFDYTSCYILSYVFPNYWLWLWFAFVWMYYTMHILVHFLC